MKIQDRHDGILKGLLISLIGILTVLILGLIIGLITEGNYLAALGIILGLTIIAIPPTIGYYLGKSRE
jgi:hypothetical protein